MLPVIIVAKRYNRETLKFVTKGKPLHQVLDMTVEAGARIFRRHPNDRQ